MKNTAIDYAKINDAVMQNAPLDTLIVLCRDIDLESCFDPVYFYHGKSRIRVSEHFKPQGRTYGEIAAETIRYVAQEGKSEKIIAPAS